MSTAPLPASRQRVLQLGLIAFCLGLHFGPVNWAGTLAGQVRDSSW